MTEKERKRLKACNLSAFKDRTPELHRQLQQFKPSSKLIFDYGSGPDILIDGTLFYKQGPGAIVEENLQEFLRQPPRLIALSRPQKGQCDKPTHDFMNATLRRTRQAGIKLSDTPQADVFYYLFAFGTGLGQHLEQITDRVDCQVLFLIEPNVELFYGSLEVIDWGRLMEGFEAKGGNVQFLINVPESQLRDIFLQILRNNVCSIEGISYFVNYESTYFANAIKILRENTPFLVQALGFYSDELMMLDNTYRNLSSGKALIFNRSEKNQIDCPAFVIGSGPSLDQDLPFIRAHAERAIIISSGSAIRPLLKERIIPDFQVEIENIDVLPVIAQAGEIANTSTICLVAASSVDPAILDRFGDVVFYFRPIGTPRVAFDMSGENSLIFCDPTVVNASLSFARETGFREIYLFGCDMGMKNLARHHAADTYHYTDGGEAAFDWYDVAVPGNFGGRCHSSDWLLFTRFRLSKAVQLFDEIFGNDCRYFNCSDGVLIEGFAPVRSETLTLPEIRHGKATSRKKILSAFTRYSREKLEKTWDEVKGVQDITALTDRLIETAQSAETFWDKSYLTRLLLLLPHDVGGLGVRWMRGTLLMMLIYLEYFLNRVADEKEKDELEAIVRSEFLKRVKKLRETAISDLRSIVRRTAAQRRAQLAPKPELPEEITPPPGPPPEQSEDEELVKPQTFLSADRFDNIPRNALCPCGSGKRFKHCHGRAA